MYTRSAVRLKMWRGSPPLPISRAPPEKLRSKNRVTSQTPQSTQVITLPPTHYYCISLITFLSSRHAVHASCIQCNTREAPSPRSCSPLCVQRSRIPSAVKARQTGTRRGQPSPTGRGCVPPLAAVSVAAHRLGDPGETADHEPKMVMEAPPSAFPPQHCPSD